jgi:hypothetical protein
MKHWLGIFVAVAGLSLLQPLAHANDYANDPFDPAIARSAWLMIGSAEKQNNIPQGLLHAMSLVETGQGISGWMMPWPYTVGINGTGKKDFKSATEALLQLQHWRALGFARFNLSINAKSLTNIKGAAAESALMAAGTGFTYVRLEGRNFARRFNNATEAEAFLLRLFAAGYRNVDVGMMQINWRVHSQHFRSVREALEPTRNLAYAVQYLLTHRQTRDWWGSVGRYHSGTALYANRYVRNVYSMYMRIHRANNNA